MILTSRISTLMVESGFINQIIRGVIKWRKCPDCDKYGIELQWYDENGNPVKTGTPNASQSDCECETCGGIGFIDITTDDDLKNEL